MLSIQSTKAKKNNTSDNCIFLRKKKKTEQNPVQSFAYCAIAVLLFVCFYTTIEHCSVTRKSNNRFMFIIIHAYKQQIP